MIKNLGTSFTGLWTDPGAEHTGFVIARIQDRTFKILAASEANGLFESAKLLREAVQDWGVTLWCYEGFRLYESKAEIKIHSEFEEVQTIGAMRYEASFHSNLIIHKQFAHQIKVIPYEDQALRKMGFNLKSFSSGHTRDAVRHLLRFWCGELKYGYPKVVGTFGYPQKVDDHGLL